MRGLLAEAAADLEQVLTRLETVSQLHIPAKRALAQATVGGLLHLTYTHICDGNPERDDAVTAMAAMFIGSIAITNPAWAIEAHAQLGDSVP